MVIVIKATSSIPLLFFDREGTGSWISMSLSSEGLRGEMPIHHRCWNMCYVFSVLSCKRQDDGRIITLAVPPVPLFWS